MRTRIMDMLGIEIPIFQAPMGFIARAQLASAVSNAGGLGILETGTAEWDVLRAEVSKMRELTERPWGVNVPQLLVRDEVIDFILEQGVRFVTTSAGDPANMVPRLKAEGLTVFHVVPTLRGALKAVAAGADGIVVEGVEGGGFKNPDGASTMVLAPLVCAAVDVPVVVAGGVVDGASMAAAFALGAEGVQMGTRMLTSAESPVHPNWKRAACEATEADTFIINRKGRPAMRVLRTALTEQVEPLGKAPMADMEGIQRLYFGGEMEASYPYSGQVVGRIDDVKPVADILRETWDECRRVLRELGERASDARAGA